MHELSIIIDLIGLCEENAKKNKAEQVDEIIIKIGKLSGVEAHYLQSAFEFYHVTSDICKNAKLTINIQPVIVFCNDCNQNSELKDNNFKCQKCGSRNLKVIDGEDMYLMQIIMH